MSFCVNCGAKVDDNAAFCSNCGTALKINQTAEAEVVEETAAVTEEVQETESVEAEVETAVSEEPAAEPEAESVIEDEAAPEAPAQEIPAAVVTPVAAAAGAMQAPVPEAAPAPAPVQPVYTAPANNNVVNIQTAPPRSQGKAIAGFILGICALSLGILTALFGILAIVPYAGIAMMICAIYMGIFAIGCAIPGLILSSKAYKEDETNKKARLGKKFSIAGLIVGGVGLLIGIIFGCISAVISIGQDYIY